MGIGIGPKKGKPIEAKLKPKPKDSKMLAPKQQRELIEKLYKELGTVIRQLKTEILSYFEACGSDWKQQGNLTPLQPTLPEMPQQPDYGMMDTIAYPELQQEEGPNLLDLSYPSLSGIEEEEEEAGSQPTDFMTESGSILGSQPAFPNAGDIRPRDSPGRQLLPTLMVRAIDGANIDHWRPEDSPARHILPTLTGRAINGANIDHWRPEDSPSEFR